MTSRPPSITPPGWLGLGLALGVLLGAALPRARRSRRAPGHATDQLTGFLTRQAFEQRRRPAPRQPWTLALIDLNRLKAVNTLHGHTGGDTYIARSSRALRAALPAHSVLCRWGGDEFLALLPCPQEAARAALQRAGQLAPHPLAGGPAFAYGLTAWSRDIPFERALVLADHQLYAAKAALEVRLGPPRSLQAFAHHLAGLETPAAVIQQGLGQLRALLDFDVAQYISYDGALLTREYVDVRAGLELPGLGLGQSIPGGALTRQVLTEARTVVSVDYPAHPLAAPAWVALGTKSLVMTPVLEGPTVVGILTLVQVTGWHAVTPQVQQVVELAALRLGHALEVQRLRDDLARRP